MPLEEDDAKACPRYDPSENPPGSRPWLAISLDRRKQITHIVQRVVPLGRSETEDNAFAATVLLQSLEANYDDDGFSVGEPGGTC